MYCLFIQSIKMASLTSWGMSWPSLCVKEDNLEDPHISLLWQLASVLFSISESGGLLMLERGRGLSVMTCLSESLSKT